MIVAKSMVAGKAGFIALFLLLSAIIIELKPFPANGWALDIYESVNSGIVTIIASGTSAAMIFVVYKISPLLNSDLLITTAGIGLTTFIFSNLLGLKQDNPKRLLGYSSIGQIGLIVAAYTLLVNAGFAQNSKIVILIVSGLFINHFLSLIHI